jgi:hypothetical protein
MTYGNVFQNDSIILRGLPAGTYIVGVQNIDNSFAASAFVTTSVTVNFVMPELVAARACEDSNAHIEVLGNSIVWYKSENLTDSIGHGNIFTPAIKKSDSVFYAVQKQGTNKSPALKVTVKVSRKISDTINHDGDSLVAPLASTYQWMSNESLLPGKTSQKLYAKTPGEYSVRVTNGPCIEQIIIFMLRPKTPTVSFTDQLCVDEAQVVEAVGNDIKWFDNNGLQIGSGSSFTNSKVSLNDTSVFVTQTVGGVSSEKKKVSWIVSPYPSKTIVYANGMMVAPAGVSYQWFLNNEKITGATSRELNMTTDGAYHVVVSNYSCVTESDKFLYTGVEDPAGGVKLFQVLPDGHVVIQAGQQTVEEIRVYDSSGKEVLRLNDLSSTEERYFIDAHTLGSGLYIVKVKCKKPFHGKFIKT